MRGIRTIGKALLICLIWSICCVPIVSALAEVTCEFYGEVMDVSGMPLGGVVVTARSNGSVVGSQKTDVLGYWRIKLPDGIYSFSFEKAGYTIAGKNAAYTGAARQNVGSASAKPIAGGDSIAALGTQGIAAEYNFVPPTSMLETNSLVPISQQGAQSGNGAGFITQGSEEDAALDAGFSIMPLGEEPSSEKPGDGEEDDSGESGEQDTLFGEGKGSGAAGSGSGKGPQVEASATSAQGFILTPSGEAKAGPFTVEWATPQLSDGQSVGSYSILVRDQTLGEIIDSVSWHINTSYTVTLPCERDVLIEVTAYSGDAKALVRDSIVLETPKAKVSVSGATIDDTFTITLTDTSAESAELFVDGVSAGTYDVESGSAIARYAFAKPGQYAVHFLLTFPPSALSSAVSTGRTAVTVKVGAPRDLALVPTYYAPGGDGVKVSWAPGTGALTHTVELLGTDFALVGAASPVFIPDSVFARVKDYAVCVTASNGTPALDSSVQMTLASNEGAAASGILTADGMIEQPLLGAIEQPLDAAPLVGLIGEIMPLAFGLDFAFANVSAQILLDTSLDFDLIDLPTGTESVKLTLTCTDPLGTPQVIVKPVSSPGATSMSDTIHKSSFNAGSYLLKAEALDSSNTVIIGVPTPSVTFKVVADSLPAPTITWPAAGMPLKKSAIVTASWNAVADAEGYEAKLYKGTGAGKSLLDTKSGINKTANTSTFSAPCDTAGNYTVEITAKSTSHLDSVSSVVFSCVDALPQVDLTAVPASAPSGQNFVVTFPALPVYSGAGGLLTTISYEIKLGTDADTYANTTPNSEITRTIPAANVPAGGSSQILTVVATDTALVGDKLTASTATKGISFSAKLAKPEVSQTVISVAQGKPVSLTWQPVVGTTKYNILDGSGTVIDEATFGSGEICNRTVALSELWAKGSYAVSVVAVGNGTTTFSSDPASVFVTVIDQLPMTTAIHAPAEHLLGTDLGVRWEPVTNATAYGIELYSPSSPTTPVAKGDVADPSALLLGRWFTVAGTYELRVTAKAIDTVTGDPIYAESGAKKHSFTVASTVSSASQVSAFTIAPATTPALNTDLKMTWTASTPNTAETYSYKLTYPDGTEDNTGSGPVREFTIPKGKLTVAGKYKFTVTAFNDAGTYSPRAVTLEFTIGNGTAAEDLDAPVINAIVAHYTNVALTATWARVEHATGYSAELTKPTGEKVSGTVFPGMNTALFAPSHFATTGQYTVTITAEDSTGGYNPASASKTFTVSPGSTMVPPVIEEFTTHPSGKPLVVNWAAVTGATSYESLLYVPSSTAPIIGIINGTTASYGATYLQTDGTYVVTVRAIGANQTYTESAVTFHVMTGLATPVITPISSHTANKALTVNWGAVQGATVYTVILTLPNKTTVQYSVNTNTVTFAAEHFKTTGSYSVKVIASASDKASSDSSITFTVGSGGGNNGGNSGGNSGGSTPAPNPNATPAPGGSYPTGALKAAFGTTDQRKSSSAYVKDLYAGIRANSQQDMTIMEMLVIALGPVPSDWNLPQYSGARVDAMSDYALAYSIMLVNLACTNEALGSSEALQIISSAVGGILDLLLDPSNSLDINARNAITALRDRFKSVASSSAIGVLPEDLKGIVDMLMGRVLQNMEDDELAIAKAIITDILACLDEMRSESQQLRSLHVAYTLVASLEKQVTSAVNALPASASIEQITAAQEIYLRYVVALAQLEEIAVKLGNADRSDIGQYLQTEKERCNNVMSAFGALVH